MSRAAIGAGVVLTILALVAATQYVTVGELQQQIRTDVDQRVQRARLLHENSTTLQGLSVLKTAESFARDLDLGRALLAKLGSSERYTRSTAAFDRFIAATDKKTQKADYLWLLDSAGDVAAMPGFTQPTAPALLKDKQGQLLHGAITLALSQNRSTSEVWSHNSEMLRVGVAPVIKINDEGISSTIGAIVVGYTVTAQQAQQDYRLLGAHVAYFYENKIYRTSFRGKGGGEDTLLHNSLVAAPSAKELREEALTYGKGQRKQLSVGAKTFIATAGRLPQFSTTVLPAEYPNKAGALLLVSLDDAMAPLQPTRYAIWLLGVAAALVALLGLVLVSRRFLSQADDLQVAINDVIGGNIDRTFQSVGKELDGVAHGLNVMLSRLVGRPEPGDEDFGVAEQNAAAMRFDTTEMSAKDAANLALAQEDEDDYLKRIFSEYIEAKQKLGQPTSENYERFVTRLRMSEANLKARFQCKAVRFRVSEKEDKVTLKPVPIL